MKHAGKKILIFVFFILCLGSSFGFYQASVDQSLRYRPLANGWASTYAGILTDTEFTWMEKMTRVLSDDLAHGRFRPAFSYFISSGYFISPVVHGRAFSEGDRSFFQKMNGDLRLFTIILLSIVAGSFFFLSMVVYKETGRLFFCLIPLFFIPLSPSLIENLMHSYIDSQEIPMVFLLCLALFFLFYVDRYKRRVVKLLLLFCSLLFLSLAFCMKETMVIMSVASGIVFASTFLLDRFWSKGEVKAFPLINLFLFFVVSMMLSVLVYAIVSSADGEGYASAYNYRNSTHLLTAVGRWWQPLSKYTLNNFYCYVPVLISWAILFGRGNKTIGGKSVRDHLILQLFLLLLSIGFFLILLPWNPVLIKYVYPSVFFLSFLVAHSLSLISRWGTDKFGRFFTTASYGLIIPYIILFLGYRPDSELERVYWLEQTNYGIRINDSIARYIDQQFSGLRKRPLRLYIGYERDGSWGNPIQWSELQIMRMLNLDYGFNIVDLNGNRISGLSMPQAELSSFASYPSSSKDVYVSDDDGEIKVYDFDVVLLGYKDETIPLRKVKFGTREYQLAGTQFAYKNNVGLTNFTMHEYLPLSAD